MGQLGKEFFANEFPGFNKPVVIEDDVLSTDVPLIEVPFDSFDYQMVLDQIRDLELVHGSPDHKLGLRLYPYEKEPRLIKWFYHWLWSNGEVSNNMEDLFYKIPERPIPKQEPTGIANYVQQQLANLGITCDLCAVSALGPGGILKPHRDLSPQKYPIGYFWTPLNFPKGCELKIYPYGTVNAHPGTLYIMNQQNYVHATINPSNEWRYVILGYFSTISDQFSEQIKTLISNQYLTL